MRYIVLFFLCVSSFSFLGGQDLGAFERRLYINADGDTLPYRILYPEGYTGGKSYPLLLFLHGAGERGNDNQLQLVHGAKLFLKPEIRAKYPAIVVFPQCPKDQYWARVERDPERIDWAFPLYETPGKPMRLVMELVDMLVNDTKTDASRMYVGGLSMGGMGTFELLSRMPSRFAAAIPICGGGNPLTVPLYARNTALWVFHGDADAVVPVHLSRKMVEAAQQAGGQVRYTEYPGVNHNSWDNAFAEPELLSWLFEHRNQILQRGKHRVVKSRP
jgi:predicted peptidase